jgi:hypothetical protein
MFIPPGGSQQPQSNQQLVAGEVWRERGGGPVTALVRWDMAYLVSMLSA